MYNGPCSVHNVFVFVYLCTSFRVCTFPLCIPCYLGAAVYKEAACVESKLGSSNHQKLIYCRPITAFCSQSSSSQKKTESCSFLWIIHIFPRLLSSIPFISMMVMVNAEAEEVPWKHNCGWEICLFVGLFDLCIHCFVCLLPGNIWRTNRRWEVPGVRFVLPPCFQHLQWVCPQYQPPIRSLPTSHNFVNLTKFQFIQKWLYPQYEPPWWANTPLTKKRQCALISLPHVLPCLPNYMDTPKQNLWRWL